MGVEDRQTLSLQLEEDALELEQVVITADRDARKRRESSSVVNSLSNELLSSLKVTSLSEGLAFCPGLRVESTCGNCGSNQLRMNGLDGPYSQILINGRAVFSGLASVYGLELIPSNMIDRVEVIRGGGSALYGSNAIAGTVNIITREPLSNRYEVQMQTAMVGVGNDPKSDNNIQFNTSLSSENSKHGLALYGFHRKRSPWDANDDGFSELSKIENTTMGLHYTLKPGYRSKLMTDYFYINESRRGGDSFNLPVHETDITEATRHLINSANISYHLFVNDNQELRLYTASQWIMRDSYYGADKALDAYGMTKDLSYAVGGQYKIQSANNNIIIGSELTGGHLKDEKLGYREYYYDNETETIEENFLPGRKVADQQMMVGGIFSQWEKRMGLWSFSAGLRMDHYNISDDISTSPDISNTVVSPRLNLMYGLKKDIQARLSYAKGFRAPQLFDEDLHVETSGARQVFHVNDPDLEQEVSHSYMFSLNYQYRRGSTNIELLAETFYTDLKNPFANEFGNPDEDGVVYYTRVNEKGGALVKGINLELTWIPAARFRFNGSYTIQSSRFGAPQKFDEKRFFRTPDQYGFFTMQWEASPKITLSTNATYTGNMLIPYFGPLALDPDEGQLNKSASFFDLSFRVKYNLNTEFGVFQLYAGINNIFDSYQTDHDRGPDKDPGYIYGPITPRTINLGLNISNFIKK